MIFASMADSHRLAHAGSQLKRASPHINVPAFKPKKEPRKKTYSFILGRIVSIPRLAVFTRQLATLVRAGMPIMRSLEVLARQERSAAFKRVIESIIETVRSGGNFSDGVWLHPQVFDPFFHDMVKAGEVGGVLDTVLERLAGFMESAGRIKGKVKAAMVYPLIIVLVAIGIVSALMVFVVPKFQDIFSGLLKGQPLPGLTRAVLTVSLLLKEQALVAVGVMGVVYAGWAFFRRTQLGNRVIDRGIIKLPLLGEVLLKASVARFTRTFGTLLASGVPILQALTITRDTAGNSEVAKAITTVRDRVKEGDTVARPLEATRVFPGMVTSMIEVGEETGALPEMLTRIADTYDQEVDNAVAGLTSIIEPVMIVFMALIVGTIVIALFLPIVKIIQLMS